LQSSFTKVGFLFLQFQVEFETLFEPFKPYIYIYCNSKPKSWNLIFYIMWFLKFLCNLKHPKSPTISLICVTILPWFQGLKNPHTIINVMPSLDLELISMIQFETNLCSIYFIWLFKFTSMEIKTWEFAWNNLTQQFNPTFLVHHPNNQFWIATKMETQKQTITFHLQMYMYIQHTYNLWM
jgi:hypothetical protein